MSDGPLFILVVCLNEDRRRAALRAVERQEEQLGHTTRRRGGGWLTVVRRDGVREYRFVREQDTGVEFLPGRGWTLRGFKMSRGTSARRTTAGRPDLPCKHGQAAHLSCELCITQEAPRG